MTMTYAEMNKVYRHVQDVKEELGPNVKRHDRVVILIGVCIESGFDTRDKIIKALGVAGLSKAFVASILADQTGDLPGMHLWRCGADGRYHLLAEA